MRDDSRSGHSAGAELVEFKHLTMQAGPPALGALRRELDAWLVALAIPPETRGALLLAANEAVTNSVEHAYPAPQDGTVELSCWLDTGVAYIEVADHGSWRAPQEHNGRRDQDGHGIPLMRACVDVVRIEHDRLGTRVLIQQAVLPVG